MSRPSAALLSIGDELALGHTVDTNTAWLAARLSDLGVVVPEHATVGDDRAALARALRRLALDHDLVVATGGLGPTADDLTRFALAEVLGEELVEDAGAIGALEEWFSGREGGMPAQNRVQARRPASSRFLKNPHGTAPGIEAKVLEGERGTAVYCLPGPPREMKPMFSSAVAPAALDLAGRLGGGGAARSRLILTFGMGESAIAERLSAFMERDRPERGEPLVGTTASRGVVTCRVRTTPGGGPALEQLERAEAAIRDALPPALILGTRDITPDQPADGEPEGHPLVIDVLDRLGRAGQRLATVESCTGGLIGRLLTDVPGSSRAYAGGWVTYSNDLKSAFVGVPSKLIGEHGAVSARVAIEMATGGLARARQADITVTHAVAVTGVAGPGGGTEEKPVGTAWISLASRDLDEPEGVAAFARRFQFRGGRDNVRHWSALAALGLVRLRLMGDDLTLLGEVQRVRGNEVA